MLAAVSAGAAFYLAARYPHLVDIILLRPLDAVIVGVLVIVLVLEALRRGTGLTLPIIVAVFIVYALVADMVPGRLQGRATGWHSADPRWPCSPPRSEPLCRASSRHTW